jgi:hypothetical protein
MRADANYTLNIVPVEVGDRAILRVGRQPYDDEALRSLRAAYSETHYFKRDLEEDKILCVSLTDGREPLGLSVSDCACQDAPWLVTSLVLEALLRYFLSAGRRVLAYRPLRVVTKQSADELLFASAPKGMQIPRWLERRVSYNFDTRIVYAGRESVPTLACDVRVTNIIGAPCSELVARGIPLEGRYVQVNRPDGDPRLSPRRRLVGRVAAVRGEQLELDEFEAGGSSTVRASDTYLEPRYENVKWCLAHLFPDAAADIINRADGKAIELRGGRARLTRIRAMFDHLRSLKLELAPAVPFTLGQCVRPSSQPWHPSSDVIPKPLLVFDPTGQRVEKWNQGGLDKHGPYDRPYFAPKIPRIVVVCQQAVQGQVEQFVRKFFDGMPDARVGRDNKAPFEKGFIRRYHLQKAVVETFTTTGPDASSYAEACRRAIASATDRKLSWDLALVQIDDAFHLLSGNENPYLVTKSIFLQHQVPVQEVTLEKMTAPVGDLVYIMNDVSLASYAKLGGIPWLLKAHPPVAHELVIGLGSHERRASRFGAHERVVGITTVFSADGNYLLDNVTKAVPYEGYAAAMLDAVQRAVEEVKREQNWRSSDAVRLIFHAFKPLRDEEVATVTKAVTQLGHERAGFAFLHVAADHSYHVFNERNPGVKIGGGRVKGLYAPDRGLALTLNSKEVLLAFGGSYEVKKPEDGIPQPALLKLHRGSTFTDMGYLAKQAFSFACHSWRTFSPAPLPITILYSDLIARLLRGLDDVSSWNPDAMLGQIGRTRWFL